MVRRNRADGTTRAPSVLETLPVAATSCAPGDVVAGYRVVRRLGLGSDCEVLLGVAQSGSDGADHRTVAVKVFSPIVDRGRIGVEIEALSRLHHDHIVRLLDVAITPADVPCLILERLAGGSLASLVAARVGLSAGEAVTILAPIASALDAMHSSGVVHGGLRLSSVLFRESGAPVIAGFGAAALIPPGLPPARLVGIDAVQEDRRALAKIVAAVTAAVDYVDVGGGVTGVATDVRFDENPAVDDLAVDDYAADDYGTALADRLFAWADPRPVLLPRADGRGRPVPPARAAPVAPAATSRSRVSGALSTSSDVPPARRRHAAPTGAAAWRPANAANRPRGFSRAPTEGARAVLRTVTTHARGVRPRFWVAAAGVAISLGVGLVIVPAGDRGAGSRGPERAAVGDEAAGSTGAAGSVGADDADTSDGPGRRDGATPDDSSAPGTTDGSRSSDAPPDGVDPTTSDDPLVALAALLERRRQCIRDVSVVCLDAVAQAGSAALQSDAALVRSIQAGGEVPEDAMVPTGDLRLVERLGDSALIDLGAGAHSTTASTLVMRGEAGWRIRDYLAARPDGG